MKLANVEEKEVLVVGQEDSYESTVDAEDMSFVLHILSSNLYANPIESLVREYATNGWDAQKENGKEDEPMIVSLLTDESGSYWSVRDFGTGLSVDLVKNVYSKFGKSTKKESDEFHGCWGLGKYSGLSYTDNVHIATWNDGKKYLYLMYRAEVGIKIDKIYEKESDEPSGTEIKVYIKAWADIAKFKSACQSQLAYFENVYYNSPYVDNGYKIHQGEHYRCCTLYPMDEMHLTIGEVVYPIPWTQLNITRSRAPIAIRFKIGELGVTPNRENILIKDNTRLLMESKIAEAAAEIVTKFNKEQSDTDDITHFYRMMEGKKIIDLSGKKVLLADLTGYAKMNASTVNFKLVKDIHSYKVTLDTLLFSYQLHQSVAPFTRAPRVIAHTEQFGRSLLSYKNKGNAMPLYVNSLSIMKDYSTILITENDLNTVSTVTLRYLFETKGYTHILSLKEKHSLENYKEYLNLHKFKRKDWRQKINEYKEFTAGLLKHMNIEPQDLTKIVVPEDWIKADRAKKKKSFDYHGMRKAEGKILYHKGRFSDRWNGAKKCVFDKKEAKIKSLFNRKGLVVYASTQDEEKLANMIYFRHEHIGFIMAAKPNLKYFEQLPNHISYQKFMEGKNKIVGRAATAKVVRDYIAANAWLFSDVPFIRSLRESLANRLDWLVEYAKKYSLKDASNSTTPCDKFEEELCKIVRETRYYDYNALTELKKVQDVAHNLRFVTHLKGYKEAGVHRGESFNVHAYSGISKECVDFAVEYLKFKKSFKLDTVFYTKEYLEQMKKIEAEKSSTVLELLAEKKLADEVNEVNNQLVEDSADTMLTGVVFVDNPEGEENITDGNQVV